MRHTVGQFLGCIGNEVLGGIERDFQIGNEVCLVDGEFFTLKDGRNLLHTPALVRLTDEQSATYLVQGVGHVVRNGDTTFLLVHSQLLFLLQEFLFAQPQREDGHTQGVEVGLVGEFAIPLSVGRIGSDIILVIHLRSGVDDGTCRFGVDRASLREHVGNAEVAEHTVPRRGVAQQDVGGLYVLMDDTGLVHGVEGQGSLDGDGGDGLGIALEVYRRRTTT